MDLSADDIHIDDTDVGQSVGLLQDSISQLRLSDAFLSVRSSCGGVYELRKRLGDLLDQPTVFELLTARLGLEALYGIEANPGRIETVVACLPDSEPPERAQRYIKDLVNSFLLGFDRQCIVMARAVVEVLVEELQYDDKI